MFQMARCRVSLFAILVAGVAAAAAAEEKAASKPDVSGTWKWERTFRENTMHYTLELSKNEAGKLSGTYAVERGERDAQPGPIEDAKLDGNKLTFHVQRTFGDRELTISYEGVLSGDEIKGKSKVNIGDQEREFDWVAKRADKGSSEKKSKWIALFDGQTLKGWERVGNEESKWVVEDGAMTASGPASMLVNTTGPYKNFRYRAEVKISDGGNSGLYFRTTRKPGFTDGYEAQIDSTHTDPIRTGSLYGMCHVYKDLVKPDTWFSYEIEVRDDVWRGREMTRIKITVDDNELYEYLDFEKTFKEGYFAFQHHDPGSKVSIRKVEVMPLP